MYLQPSLRRCTTILSSRIGGFMTLTLSPRLVGFVTSNMSVNRKQYTSIYKQQAAMAQMTVALTEWYPKYLLPLLCQKVTNVTLEESFNFSGPSLSRCRFCCGPHPGTGHVRSRRLNSPINYKQKSIVNFVPNLCYPTLTTNFFLFEYNLCT